MDFNRLFFLPLLGHVTSVGQTKYDGEVEIKKFNPAAIILRVPILYGATEYNGESAVNVLIDSVKEGKVVSMDHYAIRCPTNGKK